MTTVGYVLNTTSPEVDGVAAQRGPCVTHINTLDPGASPLDYYGYELRRYREAAELTQRQLGDIVNYTGSMVGQIETARKLPTQDFSERADAALGTGGALSRLVELVMRSQLPGWFRQVAELEARAIEICTFHTHLIHGLLQTKAYARAVLGSLDQTDLDDRTEVRLARQRIFEKEEPPVFWAVISEAALRQEIGGPEIMRGQLAQLLTFEDNPRINIQVLPFSKPASTRACKARSTSSASPATQPSSIPRATEAGIQPRTRTPSRTVRSVTIISEPPRSPSRTRRS